MRYQTICLVFIFFSSALLAHQNTVYPILKNAPVGKEKKIDYSIVVDADLNKTGFKFFLKCADDKSQGCHGDNINIKASAKMPNELSYEATATLNSKESTPASKIYELTLPLPKVGTWLVDFVVSDGPNIIDQRQMPVEIVPEGPNKIEAVTYTLPFILMAMVGLRIFLFKRKKLN